MDFIILHDGNSWREDWEWCDFDIFTSEIEVWNSCFIIWVQILWKKKMMVCLQASWCTQIIGFKRLCVHLGLDLQGLFYIHLKVTTKGNTNVTKIPPLLLCSQTIGTGSPKILINLILEMSWYSLFSFLILSFLVKKNVRHVLHLKNGSALWTILF